MKYAGLLEKSIIFCSCLIFYLNQTEMAINVVYLLIAVIFSSFLSYFENDKLRTALTVGFSVLAFFWPELVVFLPLIAYDMLFYRYQYYNLVVLIPLAIFLQAASPHMAAVIIILLLLSCWIKYLVERQLKLQAKYLKLNDMTREMSLQLEKQNKELLEKQDYELHVATLNERNRIAREIHDNVGHLLSSAILQAGALKTINQNEKIREHLDSLQATLTQAMNNIRNSVHDLYDESIDLNSQLEELIKQFNFCELSYEYSIYSNPGRKLKYAFISIIREAMANIIKHSNATQASIVLREHPALYQLIIRDNGQVTGYNSDDGLGLKNMAERIRALNGQINITTDNGFAIFISVPKEGDLP